MRVGDVLASALGLLGLALGASLAWAGVGLQNLPSRSPVDGNDAVAPAKRQLALASPLRTTQGGSADPVSVELRPASYTTKTGKSELELNVEITNHRDGRVRVAVATEIFTSDGKLLETIEPQDLPLASKASAARAAATVRSQMGDGLYRVSSTVAWSDGDNATTLSRTAYVEITHGQIELLDVNDWHQRAGLIEPDDAEASP